MECLTPTVSFYIFMDDYFTSFRLLACLPTLELTTFEQEVCSTKIGYATIIGKNSCKKSNVATLNSAADIEQKRYVTCVAGYSDSSALYIGSSESCQPNRNLFALEQSWKKVYSRPTTKSIPPFQPEHGVCQNNRSELGQTQDWYTNEKMVVVLTYLPLCLNGRCCFLECVGIVLD